MRARSWVVVLWLLMTGTAAAEMVEVAPGVSVTRKSFGGPINEQPFFGLAEKSAELKQTDAAFVGEAVAAAGSRERARRRILELGWDALFAGDVATATKRFNQGFLIDPGAADVYHGLAVILFVRFDDKVYARELFQLAVRLEGRSPGVLADYGRFLAMTGDFAEARPVLEAAVAEQPDNATAWSNLGFTRLETGDREGGCRALERAGSLPSTDVQLQRDMEILAERANCS